MTDHRSRPHLPGRHPIDAYGAGGFRFAGMSHRGSLLILPSGMYAWDHGDLAGLRPGDLDAVIAERADGAEVLLIGSGRTLRAIPEAVRFALRASRVSVDVMDTGSAARTYNVMLAERRPVACALVAVD